MQMPLNMMGNNEHEKIWHSGRNSNHPLCGLTCLYFTNDLEAVRNLKNTAQHQITIASYLCNKRHSNQ